MKVGVFAEDSYSETWRNQDHHIVEMPVARNHAGSAYDADLPARINNGAATIARIAGHPVDMFADVNGLGLAFVGGAPGGADLRIAHEAVKKPLFSHFVDSVPTVFAGLGWPEVWQALTSRFWIKCVADRAHAYELENFGIPHVVQLSASAPDLQYVTEPLDPSVTRPVVSYVGTRHRDGFATDGEIKASDLLPSTLAHAVRTDMTGSAFFDAYHDLYELADPPAPDDDVHTKVRKISEYFNAKKFFLASLAVRERDRFVLFCGRKLGDVFRLMGTGWQDAYGLNCALPLTADAFVRHFRESAINLNFGDGTAEHGLNRRHFEITAAGGFMLCHDQPDVHAHFVAGVECAVFRDEFDLLDKVRYYMDHPEERAAIALAGQKRALSQHLHSHRVRAIMEMAAGMMRALPVDFSATNLHDDITAAVPTPDVVLDCGANVGQTATLFRNWYPQAEIYSFEPVRDIFEKLQTRCQDLNVHPVRKAVSNHDGSATIHLTASPESNSLLGYQENSPCAKWHAVVGQEQVETCTLDQWCQENGIAHERINIVKMDLQGGELMALKGARRVLQYAQAVYLEVFFVPLYKDAPLFAEIDAFMTSSGYRRHAVYPSDQPHDWADALYLKCPVVSGSSIPHAENVGDVIQAPAVL